MSENHSGAFNLVQKPSQCDVFKLNICDVNECQLHAKQKQMNSIVNEIMKKKKQIIKKIWLKTDEINNWLEY